MLKKFNPILAVISLFIALGFCEPALAAADTSAAAASQQLTSQANLFRDAQKKKPLAPEEKPQIVKKKEKEAPPKIPGPRFFVKKIKLEGNTVLSSAALEKYTAAYNNRETSFEELASLADKITEVYIASGYSTSQAYLPPQKIEDGTVTLQVVEGKVEAVRVEGNKYFKKEIYERAVRLRPDKVFAYQDLESSLYDLNQKPDLNAKGYIVAGKKPETSDIILKAEEKFPLHVYYGFNNRGTKLTHRLRHEVHFDHNNLLGYGDILNASVSMAEEGAFDAGFVSYEFPIDRTGTTLHLDTSYVHSRLIGDFKSSNVIGKNFSVVPSVTQNLIRSLRFVLDWFLGFEYTDSKTLVEGNKINFDRMRVLKTGPRVTFQDRGGRTILSADIDWGIPRFLGGSKDNDPKASRVNSGGDFLYYTAGLARIQRLPKSMYLVMRTNGQWTNNTLTSVEEFRAGGAYSVRGYPESDAVGDYGYNFSAELNIPIPFLPRDLKVPCTQKKASDVIRLVGFIDGAKTFFRERAAETAVKDSFLLGTGLGIRINLNPNISFQLDFGWPIGDDSSDKNRVQPHFSLKTGF